ncbi:MBL fold metallo-hydrolase [Shewanella maritima]|uniref:MBL fold metallo-hydrolase n=1 Tax=Shewanella maritima TaxID=2520507 RepID=A0A411PG61_9GAMM|nr:MBL fold metallo-hydrolase [Shewanella maritima]QBF82535.1 MBL fold metallo-hydrolase [Shewanella maritima]
MQLKHIQGYIQSIYFAVYDDKILLLDGCCKADVDRIHDYITLDLQRPISDLKAVVVTHMHPDHAGAANQLKARYGCKIITANVTGNWYSGFDGWCMFVSDILLTKWVASRLKKPRKNIWYWPRLQADYLLSDGDLIPDFEQWQVVETQGHTDRDISLFHQPTKTVYVADLAVQVKNKFIPPFPVFYPNRYKNSLQKIEQLRPSKVILAHGGEVAITHEDYLHLVSLAPTTPATHWRATKSKLAKVFKS